MKAKAMPTLVAVASTLYRPVCTVSVGRVARRSVVSVFVPL
jgi:hypothetical protein